MQYKFTNHLVHGNANGGVNINAIPAPEFMIETVAVVRNNHASDEGEQFGTFGLSQ